MVVLPALAHAQSGSPAFTGLATGSIGIVRGGDVGDFRWSPAASVAVVEESGLGAELEVSHVGDFDEDRLADSRMTSVMVNVTGVWNDVRALVRPYAVGGLGIMHARACVIDCQSAVSRTDWGMDAGGGVFVLFNETVGVRGDVRYLRSFKRSSGLPLAESGPLDFWRTSFGVTVSWPIR